MKPLLKFIQAFKPLFSKGGKLERLYPLYEAGETFMFTPDKVTKGHPHVRDPLDSKRYMITVAIALLPCVLFGMWNAGHRYHAGSGMEVGLLVDFWRGMLIFLPMLLVSYGVGGFWEVLFACVRKHEINEGFLVTGLLVPLIMPPTIPLWQVAVAVSFGVVIGKEIFGGVGYNVLNPALTARAYLFFAHPAQISGDTVWTRLSPETTFPEIIDGVTGATALAVAGAAEAQSAVQALAEAGYTWGRMAVGNIPGSFGETSFILCMLGAVLLLVTRVGSARIMISAWIGLAVGVTLMNLLPSSDPMSRLPFHYHAVMGGFAFGVTYMATDPVSAAASPLGKILYGLSIGLLVGFIRVFGTFPEVTMLAILFMNVMAPMIDHFVVQAHIHRRAHRA